MNLQENIDRIKQIMEADKGEIMLYHGSNNRDIYTKFHDNQFYTVNDYIASNYAFNFGGLMYKVKVSNLNPYELKSYSPSRDPENYENTISLLTNLYDEDVAGRYAQRYFTPSPSSTFHPYGWHPIIKWCKENGYDSIKFVDESFDTYVHDTSYVIFDGSRVNIVAVYEVEDAVNSNFSGEFKRIK
jgi:hypothetical protein